MDFLQINKFSELHDNKKVVFCKTDFIFNEFNRIKNLENDIVLITGNSDYPITDDHVSKIPKNIKKWFAQNTLTNSEIVSPLPLGLENKNVSLREGHGIGYFDRVSEKEHHLTNQNSLDPTKYIYANFDIRTNQAERLKYKNASIKLPHIDWEENNLTLGNYFNKILEYKMILCPVGNGVDTHRLWETLYSNRIPITVKVGDFQIYNLYKEFPIIVLDNFSDLENKTLIDDKYNEVISRDFNKGSLTYNFWKNRILSYV